MKELNLNYQIKFKPNEAGIAILKKEYDEAHLPFTLNSDENGYVEMQLWRFMQLFGPHIGAGTFLPVDPNIIINEEYLKDFSQGKTL